ncbi:hypothetical protein ACWE42_06530 [Sutcliffiella cohnii]
MLYQKNRAGWRLFALGSLLITFAFIVSTFLPFGKRMWSPSFALLTAGITILLLVALHILFDRAHKLTTIHSITQVVVSFFNAFGRNAFFIYFGKSIVLSLLLNIPLGDGENPVSIYRWLFSWIDSFSVNPPLTYALFMLTLWTIIALFLHKFKWYVKL